MHSAHALMLKKIEYYHIIKHLYKNSPLMEANPYRCLNGPTTSLALIQVPVISPLQSPSLIYIFPIFGT